MGFFGRLLGRDGAERVPRWARFFSPGDWQAFVSTVEHHLAEQGWDARRREGVVVLRLPDGRPLQVGLQTLAQQCRSAEARDWPVLVAAHFARIVSGGAEAESFDRTDFEQARARLKIRLYPAEAVDADPDLDLVAFRPAEGLVAALVYDHPHTVASVPATDLEAWGKEPDELFEIARENTRGESLIRDRIDVAKGVTVQVRHGESLFAAVQLLFLDELLPDPPPWGVLAAVPTRHLLLYHPIRDARVLMAVNAMIPQILLYHRKGPGSLVPNLYWRHEGQFHTLPIGVSGKGVTFRPTLDFIEQVMEPLGGVAREEP